MWEAKKAEKGIIHCFTCLKMRRKCADVPRNSPNFHTCVQVYHLILGQFTSHWTSLHALEHLKKSAGRVRGAKGRKRHNALFHLFENASKVRWRTTKFSQLPHMRTSISPDPWLVYIPLKRSKCIRTFKKVCRSCERRKRQKRYNALFHLFENTSKVRRCTTKFSQLPPMRTSISPDPWLVYIPLNRSTCIRTFKRVCKSCERRKRQKKA